MSLKILEKLSLQNIEAQLQRKKVRYLNIRVCAPDGQVKLSAPFRMDIEKIYRFFADKIEWIKKCQERIRARKYSPALQFRSGEEHFFFGKRFILEVIEVEKKPQVKIVDECLILQVRPHSTKKIRQKIIDQFYRAELKKLIPQFIEKWQEEMDVKVAQFGIKKMKTRWGTCNIRARRIWLNLDLAKTPLDCLEYIIIHEMNHLLERKHTKRFHALMDKFYPTWRDSKIKLKSFLLR